jgi:LPXTG-site transpeptidase (sortase) family protein
VISRAREGRPAASTRIRFRPQALSLVGSGRAEVHPASTVDGELRVPENVRHLGWWDGGAYAGDPFGSTVIAGHVDSDTQGLGFFARLLRARVGDRVTLSGDGHRATYAVTAVKTITKQVLASQGRAFDQTGDHRLVLITCTGNYRADRGGYDSNLVIYAEPVGRVR